ncbi:MAG TPA: FimV/HubP family polar landmark protein [Trinickia sp.]|nr:FimV/HubP family polar landmark protein [Trinickia sp.]
MTTRSTRRAVPLAIACVWLAFAGLTGTSPAWAAPAAASNAPAAASAVQSAAAGSAATQYSVKPGQSLADIAASVTQSHDKAVLGRAARAIFDANPSAFMRGDPSLLKLGATLNVPALDATGAKAASAPTATSAAASVPNPASAGASASQAAAAASAAASASAAQAVKPASGQAVAASPTASAATGASAPANVPAPAVAGASNAAAPAAPHPQPSAPAGASGGHAWTGAIQPEPAAAASSAEPAGASAVSGAVEASAPAAAASGATTAAAGVSTSSVVAASAARGGVPASSAAAPAEAASHPKVSSLQQLLTLKNRVLMELQRHGFGAPSANRSGSAAGNAAAGASGFGGAPPASGVASAPSPGQSRAAAAANQRFIGIGGYGFSVARADIPAIASVAAAVVAALLVLLVALGVSRRRRGASALAAASSGGGVPSPVAQSGVSAQSSAPATASADDPIEAEFLATLARTPSSKRALMGLAAHYAERKNVKGFDEIAQRIYRLSGGRGPNWVHVASIGRQLDPDNPMFALEAGETDDAVLTGEPEAGVMEAPAVKAVPEHEPPAKSAEPTPTAASATPPVADIPPQAPLAAPAKPLVDTRPPVEPEAVVETHPRVEATPPELEQPEAEVGASDEATPPALGPTQASDAEWDEPPVSAGPEEVAAPNPEATLPPGAIAALDGLDMGLPPRIEPQAEGGARPVAQAHEQEHEEYERDAQAESEAQQAAAPDAEPRHDAEQAHHGDEAAHEPARHAPEETPRPGRSPTATPGVSGLGAAPIGPLALSFDLDLPGDGTGAREGEPAALAPEPQFTPEQLARIARNKLDLAGEYIALGDLGGARTLIHEVIESDDAATRDEAHALLATLAPLS